MTSRAAARDHIGFIVEPEAAMLLQHGVGGLEIASVADHLRQPDILDLRDIDRGIPGREQRRGADRARNLVAVRGLECRDLDRKSTRLNSSHANISYAVFCL